jgi:hypothetical protein
MRKFISLIVSLTIILSCVAPTFAWGAEGHRVVGAEAAMYVKPETLCRVNAILLGESMADVSSWADSLKRRPDDDDLDPATVEFLAEDKNDRNDKWHFDDLPLGCVDYNSCDGFTPDFDIVHMINFCIRRLQGQGDVNHPISERNALRMLIHLVGDLHQPMHVGSGYINSKDPKNIVIETDPKRIIQFKFPDDIGGNALVFRFKPVREKEEREGALHSFWDTELVQRLMKKAKDTKSPEVFGQFLKRDVKPDISWDPQGSDLSSWAAQWATDSLKMSRQHAYNEVKIVDKHKNDFGDNVFGITRGDVSVYDKQAEETARTQLAKAGYRLAKLLDAIYSSK